MMIYKEITALVFKEIYGILSVVQQIRGENADV